MFLVYLWNYIRGYVIITVTGRNIERFINICSRRNILLWEIIRINQDSAQMKASIRGFKHMRPAARKSRCKVRISKRCGLPFKFSRFRRRKGFKLGVIIFSVLILLSMSIIWDIEITGSDPELNSKIMTVLHENSIGRGSLKMNIDAKKIASEISLGVDEIAWVGVEVKGVKLYITFKDRVSTPTVIDSDQLYNIVANRDGLITRLEVYAGNALVKEGDTVKKGQVLVSGTMQSQNPDNGTREVHALGKIIARTWYQCSLPVSSVYTQRFKTGNTHKVSYLRFLDCKIKLPSNPLTFSLYDTEVEDKIITGPFGIKLPIGLTVEISSEIMEKQVDLTDEEAVDVAVEMAREDLRKIIPRESTIIDEVVKEIEGENGTIYVQVVIECEEDLAKLEPVNDE